MSCPKTVTLHRSMSYVTPHLITPSTGTPSLSPTLSSSHVLHPPLSEHKPCGDLRPHLSGAFVEPPDPLQCQLIGGMPRFLGPFPGGLSRFIPCQMCAQYSGLRHLGWPSRGHGLSSRPQESCNRAVWMPSLGFLVIRPAQLRS